MTRTSPPQLAFSSGEIDPLLHRRPDYQKFQTGLAVCRGFMPLLQGGVTRAPGTFHRGATRINAQGRVIPFQFAANDAVVLEFTNLRMRVWRYGALVMDGASPYELVTPYTTAALARLKWSQSADVIRLADGVLPIQRLARQALDSWTINDETFNKGPFRAQNLTKANTIEANDDVGTVTLTASFSFFTVAHEGSLLELRPSDNTSVLLWESNESSIAVNSYRRNGRNTYQLIQKGGANVGPNPPVHGSGSVRVDNSPTVWKFISSDVGIVRIVNRVSATTATADVIQAIPRGCLLDPTYAWAEGAWSDIYGYPSSLELFDQRLAAAGTPADPRTTWFSVVGNFRDFTSGVAADEGFAYSIAGDASVNAVLNLKRGKTGLHIFALGEEYSSRSDTRNQVIGPTTAVFSHNSSQGASSARPIAVDGNPVFITRDGRRLVEISYSFEQDANVARILSLPSQHLGNDAFQEIVWQSAPQPTAWIRRTTGDLVLMVYDRQEEVLGWATVPVAGGVVESLAVTTDATGTKDIVTMIVRRVVNGATVRLVEEQAVNYAVLTGDDPIAEANHLFAATRFTPGVPTAVFSLPHLAGEVVHAWTDGGAFGPVTVALDGAVTLPSEVTQAIIGLFDATHLFETLDITAQAPDGSSIGRQKRLHSGTGIGLHRTAQGHVAAVEYEIGRPAREMLPVPLIPMQAGTDLTQAFRGVISAPAPSGMARELALRFTPTGGAPMTVTAIIPPVQEAGR